MTIESIKLSVYHEPGQVRFPCGQLSGNSQRVLCFGCPVIVCYRAEFTAQALRRRVSSFLQRPWRLLPSPARYPAGFGRLARALRLNISNCSGERRIESAHHLSAIVAVLLSLSPLPYSAEKRAM